MQWIAIGIALTSMACGGTDFAGTAGSRSSTPPPSQSDNIVAANPSEPGSSPASDRQYVSWSLPCGAEQATEARMLESDITGGGDFEADPSSLGYDITLSGSLCPGSVSPSDVVFLLDGSSSMRRNDPYVNGTCGRLETIKSVIADFESKGASRFAVIAFSNGDRDTVIESGGFFDDEASLFQALSSARNGAAIGEVICNSNRLGTNYDTGFAALDDLVRSNSLPSADVKVFMVSDGKPLFRQTGESIATQMKQRGVTIGTVAVRGDPDVLRDTLASRDAQGQVLFASVTQIADLTQAILGLSQRTAKGANISYRAIGASDWVTAPVVTSSSGLDFQGPIIGFDQEAYPQGLEIELVTYNGGVTAALKGRVLWP